MGSNAKRARDTLFNDEVGAMSVIRSFLSADDQDAAAEIDTSFQSPRDILRKRVHVEMLSKLTRALGSLPPVTHPLGYLLPPPLSRVLAQKWSYEKMQHNMGLKENKGARYQHGIEVAPKRLVSPWWFDFSNAYREEWLRTPNERVYKHCPGHQYTSRYRASIKRLRLGWKMNGMRGYSKLKRVELVRGLMAL